jgi:hypothetical protein
MGMIVTKLEETISDSIAMFIVVLNLRKIQLALLQLLLDWLLKYGSGCEMAFIQ